MQFICLKNYFKLRSTFIVFLILTSNQNLYAQNTKKETGSYKMRLENSMSWDQAVKICTERARINAIEKAFGQTIIQGNSTYIQNINTGQKVESNSVFNLMSESLVNGDWLKDLSPPKINKYTLNEDVYIEVEVKGEIAEIKALETTFVAKTLGCPKVECEIDKFNHGQGFYLYFKAPENGFVSVYLDAPEDGKTYKILPYSNKNEVNYRVLADKEYVFFAKSDNVKEEFDELFCKLNNPLKPEMWKVFIMYSPYEEFGKPITQKTNETVHSDAGSLVMPASLSSSDFQKWLQTIRRSSKKVQLYSTTITVTPN